MFETMRGSKCNLAMAYRQSGRAQAAIDLYRDLLKNDPNDQITLYQLQLVLDQQDGNEEEVKKIEEKLKQLRSVNHGKKPIEEIPSPKINPKK